MPTPMMGTAYTKVLREETSEPRTLEPYSLVEPLGENAFDTVHLARLDGAHALRRWVALRVFEGKGARDRAAVHAIGEEARTAASIVHPNLMTVIDVGDTDGVRWIATEYLLGESADEILRQAERAVVPVPWTIATRIVADAADALAAMHARRMVHGSVSPRSLLVTYTGTTKLKAPFAPKRDRGVDARDAAYVPPGAHGPFAADAAADVYALAAILWELCAGRRLEVWDARAPREISSLARAVGVPESIDTILQRALGQGARGTARELARALRGALVVEGIVVEEHDVGHYVESRFAERHALREARLVEVDADATEVFHFSALDAAPDTMRELPSGEEELDDTGNETLVLQRRDPAPVSSFVKAQPVIVIGPGAATMAGSSMAPPALTAPFAVPTRTLAMAPPAPVARPVVPSIAPTTSALSAAPTVPPARRAKRRALWPAMIAATFLVATVASAFVLQRAHRADALSAARPSPIAAVKPPAPPIAPTPPEPPAPSAIAPAPPVVDGPPVTSAIVSIAPSPVAAPRPRVAPEPRARAAVAAPPRASGNLTVVCVPACDDVRDDGRSLGGSPIFKAIVGAGVHHLTLTSADPAVEKQVTVTVGEDETVLVREEMQ